MTRIAVINGDRIKQARELNGLTQSELSKLVGCNQSAIAHFENNRTAPSEEVLNQIADATNVLPGFFEKQPVNGFSLGTLSYRSRNSLTKKEESRAYQFALTMFEQIKTLSSKLSLPAMRFPRLSEKPNLSARMARVSLGLEPSKPIARLINAFEYSGGIILITPFSLPNIDAFSHWVDLDVDRPIIFVSAHIPGDRLRFSIAHEMGHLVMHIAPTGKVASMEKEANNFAAELLMPEDVIKNELTLPVTLTSVANLKPKWGVSMQALIYRSHDLKIITDRQYRYLFEQLSARGWRTKEPSNLDIPIEAPQAFTKMIKTVYRDTESYADDIGFKPSLAKELIAYN